MSKDSKRIAILMHFGNLAWRQGKIRAKLRRWSRRFR